MTRLRGLVALVALAAVIVGVPWALLRFGEWPINGIPSGEQLRDLGDSVVSDTAVFAVLTVAAWAVWAVFMLSVLIEAAAAVRGVQAPRLVLAGPLQRSARGLVAAIVLSVTIQHASPRADAASSPSAPLVERAAVVLDIGDPTAPSAPAARAPTLPEDAPATAAEPGGAVITVQRGDSAWSIAETHLGDGIRWRDLWDANHGVTQPDGRSWTDPQVIRVGWQLHLPAAATAPERDAAATTPAVGVYTVVRGDTLSGIAAQHLGDAARYTDVFELNSGVEQPDGRRLTDPNLILPGWQLVIPAPSPTAPDTTETAPATGTLDVPPAEPTPTDTGADTADSTPATTSPAPAAPTGTPDPVATTVPSPPTDAAPPDVPLTTPPSNPLPALVPGAASTDQGDGSSPMAPILAGISGAIALATGLALRTRLLRRRRSTRGARHTLPTTPVEDAVTTAADVPLVRWAGQRLAELVAQFDRRRVTGAPVAVELSDDTGIEVLWDQPQHAPAPAGWTIADGGWAWRLPYDPDAPVPADELPAAIPALVTIGERDGRQLLVDLEAFGALTVSGPDDRVDALVRSIAVELAAGNDLSDAYLSVVDVATGLADHLDRVTVATIDDAIRHIDSTRRSIRDVLDHAGIDDTFRARAGDPTPIEATIVIARAADADDRERLTAAVAPRCGVAAIIVADPAEAGGPHLLLDTDGLGRLEPLGINFTPVGLPIDTARQINEMLTTLSVLPDETADPRAAPGALVVNGSGFHPNGDLTDARDESPVLSGADGNGHRPHPGAPATGDTAAAVTGSPQADDGPSAEARSVEGGRLFHLEPDAASIATDGAPMVVRVLGVPSIADRPELGRRELILTALLACRGGTLAATAAQDALWGGKPVEAKTVWNFVAATRRALGEFGDGSPVMPSADRTRGTLRLDGRVTTDLAMLADRVERSRGSSTAEAMTLLQEALGLVEGPPFDGAGYDWAHRDQDVFHASTLIEQAVEALVDLAVESGHVDAARDAITRGLRGLPGNEELYRCRMRVEHHAGNHAGIAAAYDELTVFLTDLDAEPSPATAALYHELIRRDRT